MPRRRMKAPPRRRNEKPLAYLACPHTHSSKSVVLQREKELEEIVIQLLELGFRFYSPISMTGPLTRSGARLSHGEWMMLDGPFMQKCDVLVVVCLEGWEDSEGIKKEIAYFRQEQKPIYFISKDYD